MEGMAFEIKNAWNGWKFWSIEGTVGHDQELTRHVIALIGFDPPAIVIAFPGNGGHLGAEAGIGVEVKVVCDVFAVRENFGGKRILILRHVAEFFAERQVDVGFRIAGGARVTVPVPGPTKVATFFDQAEVVKTRFL